MQNKNITKNKIGICLDCIEAINSKNKQCPKCSSPRTIFHAQIHNLEIAHIDCDAFYASVEKLDNPNLLNKPVIVGGGKRGVVATCCYIARTKGVHSAMPIFQAKKLCPNATIIMPRMQRYIEVSKQIKNMMLELTPEVEPLSIDEAFLDMSGTQELHKMSPALMLAKFAKDVHEKIGITVSIGLAANKFLAKFASDLDKPKGFFVISQKEAKNFLAKYPIKKLWGVGKKTQIKMQQQGIITISDLQNITPQTIIKNYGTIGTRLIQLANGIDNRKVVTSVKTKSVSSEATLTKDISQIKNMLPILRALAQKVSRQLKQKKIAGQTIILKLKDNNFKLITRSKTIANPTQLVDVIFRITKTMLEKEVKNKIKFRLLGVGISQLINSENADPNDLIDNKFNKAKIIEKTIDDLQEKYGSKSIELGITFKTTKQNKKPKRNKT